MKASLTEKLGRPFAEMLRRSRPSYSSCNLTRPRFPCLAVPAHATLEKSRGRQTDGLSENEHREKREELIKKAAADERRKRFIFAALLSVRPFFFFSPTLLLSQFTTDLYLKLEMDCLNGKWE